MVSWGLKTRGLRPIGLDIGHNSIKAIQLVVNGGRISVFAADEARIEPGVNSDEQARRSFVISAIKRMLAQGNFRGRDVISCVPSGKLKITSLRLSEAEKGAIEQALRKEVAQRFGLDPNDDAIDYVAAGHVRQGDELKSELIVFATDNQTIKDHIAMLEEAELKPVAIDTIPCALFRSFERSLRRQEDRELTVVFVDVGSRFTTVVFGRGGEISFVKQIPIGGERFVQQVAAKLGISISEAEMLRESLRMESGFSSLKPDAEDGPSQEDERNMDASTRGAVSDAVTSVAEDLAREVALCLRYYTVTFRGKRVERAVFAGGGAYEDILLNVLRRQLAVEIEVAEPLRGFGFSSGRGKVSFYANRRGLLCEWAVAVGLSLKGWDKVESSAPSA
ncbi:MAG TPA: pilus assembly protein PilM [Sedimentisphaerales bacterium]|nr:pilus assembly protein PilM [Sedimentisphaerales bacterium]